MDNKKDSFLTIRCQNRTAHINNGRPKEGNIVAFLGKQSIIVRCNDSKCRSWARLEFNFNNRTLDLRKAGITQSVIAPEAMNLSTIKAAVVIDGEI